MAKLIALLDHAGDVLHRITQAEADDLIRRKMVDVMRTKRRVVKVRLRMPDPPTRDLPIRRAGIGCAHKRETARNPKGVWTIDRINPELRGVFLRVVTDCLSNGTGSQASPQPLSARLFDTGI